MAGCIVIMVLLRLALCMVVPLEYNIYLDVSMETLDYSGNVTIKVMAVKSTHFIRLDSVATISNVQSSVGLEKWTKYSNHVIIDLQEEMIANQQEEIFLSFKGVIRRNSTSGFYASLENDVLAITQFETLGANTVFPCFDDPALKAYFKVGIAVDEPFHVIGNMELDMITRSNKSMYILRRLLNYPHI